MPVRIAVDAMGGDLAPHSTVEGAVQALVEHPDFELTLVGDQTVIRAMLAECASTKRTDGIRVVHASQVVSMDDLPVEALRHKKDSSVVRAVELVALGEADAVVSAGNTGACAAACQLTLKPLAGVSRPGIAVTIPSFHGPFVLCDVGANIQAKPRHLHDYAVMATVYAKEVIGIENPRVALISIGEESGKGTGLIKDAHRRLQEDSSIRYTGNVEGRELFEGKTDVAICDGFVGNIILKFVEGLAEGLFRTIAHEFNAEAADLKESIGKVLDRVWQRHDYSRYGGAPLLGVNGVCIICHGRSNAFAVRNAIVAAGAFVKRSINDTIATRLERTRTEETVRS